MMLNILVALTLNFCLVASQWDDYCDEDRCKLPMCLCGKQSPPSGMEAKDVPQFVMLTFDSAVNFNNFIFYRELILRSGRKNKKSGCPITATFFVSHEYTDYTLLNRLFSRGNEIAVHSISHSPIVDKWKNMNYTQWKDEISGMKTIISKFGLIPSTKISGVRAPFLQTGGDTYFDMLSNERFLYDSSTPTLRRADPPLWPYTLDRGLQQECQIEPCPRKLHPGIWMVPVVNWFGLPQVDKVTGNVFEQPCAMVDGCTPHPTTVEDTVRFLKKNFDRHYYSESRAPFPIFLREGWLQNKNRKEGFLNFVDELLQMDDVYFVTVRDVIDYLRAPKNTTEYNQTCFKMPGKCPVHSCSYRMTDTGAERIMKSCVQCPPSYPWVGNPTGKKMNP
ncbi:chitin deacetylase 8-like [Centruroides vittatus]|uniref:chitin deacetylase 8-like n=1 Tax=Centruroides vittatus TaxID=120091 RepID=UPI003510A191